jgi:hypothetical protein
MIGDIEAVQGILGNRDMAKAYYSTVLERPARDVSADPVGAVGNGALSAAAQSTAAVGAIGRRTVANLRIVRSGVAAADGLPGHPADDGYHRPGLRRATFDCDSDRRDELTGTPRGSFEKWLDSLRW